ncbi:helix-turn-helix domain-containing protein [Sphingomonas sp. 1P06PA]|uniref:TetR/AcrR family transcriptional regulator n=1 Tax=Sphingomonas sp. 1P06PA TaxID=554121 RepID=UPI0039A61C62
MPIRVRRSIEDMKEGRARLIRAAEALFARSGIDGASLREIANAAGQRNHNAVQYHFGTRDGLVEAIFSARMWQMEKHRAEMLSEAGRRDRLSDVRALAEIVFLPQLLLDDPDGSHSYALFLSQFLLRNSREAFGDFGAELPPNLERTLVLLRAQLDFLSEPAAQRRLLTACFMFLNMLAGQGAQGGTESFRDALEDTLEQIVVALCLRPTSAAILSSSVGNLPTERSSSSGKMSSALNEF